MRAPLRSYLFAIIFLSIILLSVAPVIVTAQERPGPPSDLIIYDVVTKVEDGILRVVTGKADVFFWPVTKADLERLKLTPEQLEKVYLIPQTTTLNALLFNPYCDNTTLGACGVATSVKDNKTHFNPFALREFRYAMNFLIDRKYIVEEIMHGSANPQYTVIGPSHPAFPRIKKAIDELGLTPEGDFEKAKKMIEGVFAKARECLNKHGYDLYKKKDPTAPAGYWWTFKRPDGTEETVTVTFLIRVEDERRLIGDYIASLLEKIGIKVDRVYIERGQVFKLVYGADPRTLSWHIYTEGWVSTAESPWIEWDIAWYYAAWFYGLLPTWQKLFWQYDPGLEKKLWNETIQEFIEEESYKLCTGVYGPKDYWRVAQELIKAGIKESIRVFLTENVQFFVVNKRVKNLVPGKSTGLYSPFVLRTATTVDGIIRIVQYSAQAALFMSAWNPVGGMTDIYSTNIWRYVREYGGYWHPSTGEFIPMSTTWEVEYNVSIDPSKVYVYKAGWMTLEEYLSKYPDDWRAKYTATTPVKVIYNYKLGAFHDGEPMTIWDVLFDITWWWEWATNDTDVRGTDPWYHPGIESSYSAIFGSIVGIEIINETAIAIYGTYKHPVSAGETAGFYMFFPTWSPVIWMAMEYCVINKGPVSGKTYGWHEGEAERYIDAFSKDHLVDIKAALDIVGRGEYVPPYVESINSLLGKFGLPVKDIADAVSKAKSFIDTYGHAVISDGPFYISKYLPAELHLELRAFRDPRYPFTETYWIKNLPYIVLELKKVALGKTIIAPGEEVSVTLFIIDHMITPEEKELPATRVWVEAILFSPVGEEIYRVGAKMVEPGKWVITIPSEVTEKLGDGDYKLLIQIGRFMGIPEIVKEVTITVLGLVKEVRELRKSVEEVTKGLESVRSQLNQSIASLRSEIEERLGKMSKELGKTLADAITGLQKALTTAMTGVEKTIKETGEVLGRGIDELRTSVSGVGGAVDDLRDSVSSLKKATDDLKKVVEEHSEKLDTITSTLTVLEALVVIAIIISIVSVIVGLKRR